MKSDEGVEKCWWDGKEGGGWGGDGQLIVDFSQLRVILYKVPFLQECVP